MGKVSLISHTERRRKFTEEQKVQILAEMEAPGAVMAEISRKYDIASSVLYGWRRLNRTAPGFAQVVVNSDSKTDAGPIIQSPPSIRVSIPGGIIVEFPCNIPAHDLACFIACIGRSICDR